MSMLTSFIPTLNTSVCIGAFISADIEVTNQMSFVILWHCDFSMFSETFL